MQYNQSIKILTISLLFIFVARGQLNALSLPDSVQKYVLYESLRQAIALHKLPDINYLSKDTIWYEASIWCDSIYEIFSPVLMPDSIEGCILKQIGINYPSMETGRSYLTIYAQYNEALFVVSLQIRTVSFADSRALKLYFKRDNGIFHLIRTGGMK